MSAIDESQTYEEITLQKIRFTASAMSCYPQDLEFNTYRDMRFQTLTDYLSWNLLGKKIETQTCPRTWWDGFKHKYFPRWLKERYPVEWDSIKLYNICPHINIDFPSNKGVHLDWINKEHGFDKHE